jgi:hypothetical protein
MFIPLVLLFFSFYFFSSVFLLFPSSSILFLGHFPLIEYSGELYRYYLRPNMGSQILSCGLHLLTKYGQDFDYFCVKYFDQAFLPSKMKRMQISHLILIQSACTCWFHNISYDNLIPWAFRVVFLIGALFFPEQRNQTIQFFVQIFTNLPNPITHLNVSSLKITKKKIQTTKSSNFISHNIFS